MRCKDALKNWKDILRWYNLPFYQKWFTKCPVKEFIEVKPKQRIHVSLDNKKLKFTVEKEKASKTKVAKKSTTSAKAKKSTE